MNFYHIHIYTNHYDKRAVKHKKSEAYNSLAFLNKLFVMAYAPKML